MNIGENIRKIRRDKKISSKYIADYIGCSQQAILQYERGERNPSIDILQKIANGLNVNINTLINWSSNLCTHEDIINFLYDILGADEDSIVYKLSPILKEDDLIKISQFISISYFDKNFYLRIADFINLNENQLYNWVLSTSIYSYNYTLSDYIIIYNELYNELSEEENFNISNLHKILITEHDIPDYILGFLDYITDDSFARYKIFITFEDSKELIINNILDKEDLDKMIFSGLSEHNNKIIFDFVEKKFNSYCSDNYKDNCNINMIDNVSHKALYNLLKNIDTPYPLEKITSDEYNLILSKVYELLNFELYKLSKKHI